MNRNRVTPCIIAAAVAAITATSPAMAGVTVDIVEVGSDVVTTASGSLDVSLWTFVVTMHLAPQMGPSEAFLFVGATADADLYLGPINFAGPTDGFGTGGAIFASSGTGDTFGLQNEPGMPALAVPTGYVSGDPLSGDATYTGQSFATHGLTDGTTFTWTWDTADGQGDFFTINVGVIPAPSSIALLGIAGMFGKRRRRNA